MTQSTNFNPDEFQGKSRKSINTTIYLKILAIVILALLLLIPTSMVSNLVRERQNNQVEAISEVSSKWGGDQTITGPFISIPYYSFKTSNGDEASSEKKIRYRHFLHILPNRLNITGEVSPEKRNRGIFEVIVFGSQINLKGDFVLPELESLDIDSANVDWEKAELIVGIGDLRGIEKQVQVKWNGQGALFNPGVNNKDLVSSGISVSIPISYDAKDNLVFDIDLDLKGSQKLYFVPVGKVTDVKINSNWPNPSFNGAFLPDTRTVTPNGFNANWNILNLNRNFPQFWIGNKFETATSSFGIDLVMPVDNYLKAYRSIHYAILFIGFTFLAFFFIENLNKVNIHIVQYILVGAALVIFYTLLLSISEQLNFNLAFLIAAIMTIGLIAWYVKSVLQSTRFSVVISTLLISLYFFIFVIIQLQDYSLLIGSLGIFSILGITMYFSKKIDWYQLPEKSED